MLENQLSRYGAIAKNLPFTHGRVFLVLNSNDSYVADVINEYPADRSGITRAYTDLATAYDQTVSGRNDVILIDSGPTSNKVSAMLTVSKNKVHFVGIDGAGIGRPNNARTLISNTGAGASTDVSMIKNTGTGNSFRNIKFSNNWTVAQNLSAFLEYGNNTYFENCTFHNLGSAHLTNANCAPLILAGGDAFFKYCTIGADTVQSTVASGQTLLIKKGTSGQAATRCIFERCWLMTSTNKTTHAFVRVAADGDIDRFVQFDECSFINFFTSSNGALMAVAAATPSGLTSGNLLFAYPRIYGATDLATAGVGNDGQLVIGTTATAASDGIAIKPTA